VTAIACAPPPSGLVSWWPGDGNYNDIIGRNSDNPIDAVSFFGRGGWRGVQFRRHGLRRRSVNSSSPATAGVRCRVGPGLFHRSLPLYPRS
jgi:hypothetical protein